MARFDDLPRLVLYVAFVLVWIVNDWIYFLDGYGRFLVIDIGQPPSKFFHLSADQISVAIHYTE